MITGHFKPPEFSICESRWRTLQTKFAIDIDKDPLIQEDIRLVGTRDGKKNPVEQLRHYVIHGLTATCQRLGDDPEIYGRQLREIENVLFDNHSKSGFTSIQGQTRSKQGKGLAERKAVIHEFAHAIYAIRSWHQTMSAMKQAADQKSIKFKARLRLAFQALMIKIGNCKNGWVSGLSQLESTCMSYCSCSVCLNLKERGHEDQGDKSMVQSMWDNRIADFRDETFVACVLRRHPRDGT